MSADTDLALVSLQSRINNFEFVRRDGRTFFMPKDAAGLPIMTKNKQPVLFAIDEVL